MESLLDFTSEGRSSFELYKSIVCHRVKEMGDIEFVINMLEQDDIRMYYRRGVVSGMSVFIGNAGLYQLHEQCLSLHEL